MLVKMLYILSIASLRNKLNTLFHMIAFEKVVSELQKYWNNWALTSSRFINLSTELSWLIRVFVKYEPYPDLLVRTRLIYPL